MKFNEKLYEIRKKQGLSQEELGFELKVSRQTISKWESGQSYPDFQKLVMLSDYFDMSLDELVKDLDVQDVREKNLTDEKVASMYLDVEKTKHWSKVALKVIYVIGSGILIVGAISLALHLIFPELELFWQTK